MDVGSASSMRRDICLAWASAEILLWPKSQTVGQTSMPRVLVTGGAGFIGSHVADTFLAKDWIVTIVDDLSTGKEENVPAAATFVRESVTSPEFAKLVRDGKFDVVAHLAGQIDVRKSVADPI